MFTASLSTLARMVIGGAAFMAISLVISRLVAASDRRMMTSESLRELSAYLFAYARFADPDVDIAAVYGRVIRQQAAFSEQLQSARALLLEKPRATRERVRLAASIGLMLDALDGLVAAQCDLPELAQAAGGARMDAPARRAHSRHRFGHPAPQPRPARASGARPARRPSARPRRRAPRGPAGCSPRTTLPPTCAQR